MSRPAKLLSYEQQEDIKRLASEGMSYERIAQKYHIARYRVSEIVEGYSYRLRYSQQDSIEERRGCDAKTLLSNVRQHWNTFKVGDNVALELRDCSHHRSVTGVISFKNAYYMNVVSGDDVISIQLSELVMAKDRAVIRLY